MGKRSAAQDISPASKRSKEADCDHVDKDTTLLQALTLPIEGFATPSEYEKHFVEELAPLLLQRVVMGIGESRYLIREVEFYFTDETHNDPFTHCSSIQESTGVWYFHRQGSGYKGGTYKGLDVAIGRGADAPGGILIRSIEDLDSGELFCGPCKCVDRILSLLNSSAIASLVEDVLEDDIAVDGGKTQKLYLELSQEVPLDEVMFSGRVGLHLTKKVPIEEQCDFVFRRYRAFTNGKQIPKGRNLMVLAQHMDGKTAEEIIAAVGGTKRSVPKWTALCDKGAEHGDVKKFAKKRLSDLQICECYGAVHTFLQRKTKA